jgi:hypothetical protein
LTVNRKGVFLERLLGMSAFVKVGRDDLVFNLIDYVSEDEEKYDIEIKKMPLVKRGGRKAQK